MPAYAYKINIKREPQEIYFDDVTFDIDCVSLDEAIMALTNLRDNLSSDICKTTIIIENDDDDGHTSQSVRLYRRETPNELASRIERQEEYNRRVEEQERQKYFELKRQFEGEDA